jgi:hypothetical protein
MYYALVGGNITQKIASSLSKWVNNRSPVLQERAKRSLKTGYTRLELRFEHLIFEPLAYYEAAMKRAYEDLICSKALRIQPIESQWESLTSMIDSCLLYIDLTNQFCVAAWFRDHSLK